MTKKKPTIQNLPDLVLTDEVNSEMSEWFDALISGIPEANITETVSQFAESSRVLSAGVAAYPGPYSFDRTPYLREIADCLSDSSPIMEVVFMKPTQIGATVGILENEIGYCIKYGIGPVLFVSGDQAMAEESMEKRVDQMIHSSGLADKIKAVVQKKHQKTTGDTKAVKSYGGTFIRAIGPNSEAKARSFNQRVLLLDEIDVYPQLMQAPGKGKASGNPIEKMLRRSESYGPNKKILYLSTPKLKHTSQIEPLFEQGDKRYFYVPCPKCKHMQPLVFSQLKFGNKDEDGKLDIGITIIDGVETITNDPVYYECIQCKHKIKNEDKEWFLIRGEWVPTKKPDRPGIRSYHLNGLYSPVGFKSWLDIAIQFKRVKDDMILYPDFVNDTLAETFAERADAPEAHELMRYAEDWETGYISNQILFLTLAADIQGDRIEAGIVGWGRERQAWVIDYWNFEGDTREVESDCWKRLAEKITNTYSRADGSQIYVSIAFVDSQYHKDQVNAFCDNNFNYSPGTINGVYPVIARESLATITKMFKNEIGTPVIGLDDQRLKKAVYNTLRKKPHRSGGYPFGFIHFPKSFGKEFYKQLTNEEVFVETNRKGVKSVSIENRKQRRNEVLDIVKYNFGAYQFALDRFFEIENKKRKDQKLKEIQQDIDLFMDAMESVLYDVAA